MTTLGSAGALAGRTDTALDVATTDGWVVCAAATEQRHAIQAVVIHRIAMLQRRRGSDRQIPSAAPKPCRDVLIEYNRRNQKKIRKFTGNR
jgi:hypothetical protein